MADLPDWVQALELGGKVQYDEPPDTIRLRGSHVDDMQGALQLSIVLEEGYYQEGYIISRVRGGTEHSRGGHRFTWQVLWITEEVAERRYQEKQATRMSRYAQEEEAR